MEFTVPRAVLSDNKMVRRQILDEYFPSGLIPFEESYGSEWKITSFFPSDPAYLVDPQIESGLALWNTTTESIGSSRRIFKNTMVSLQDAWSIYYWSLVKDWLRSKGLDFNHIVLFHIDDHQDLSSPHLIYKLDKLESIFSHAQVDFSNPSSIKDGILDKSIGIASFIAPLLNDQESVQILHLRYGHEKAEQFKISCVKEEDALLAKGRERLSLRKNRSDGHHSYSLSSDPSYLVDQIKDRSLVLLHIDCDAFNNRYNLDTNWTRFPTPDLKLEQIKARIEELFTHIGRLSCPIYLNIAVSPGFFPAEFWGETCQFILRTAEKYDIVKDDEFSEYLSAYYPEEERYEIR